MSRLILPQESRAVLEAEPHLPLVSSTIALGQRWRALYQTVHYRPIQETFHEFLVNLVKWSMGENWWIHQMHQAEGERHEVVRWNLEWQAIKRGGLGAEGDPKEGAFESDATGPAWALLMLGYDIYYAPTAVKTGSPPQPLPFPTLLRP